MARGIVVHAETLLRIVLEIILHKHGYQKDGSTLVEPIANDNFALVA